MFQLHHQRFYYWDIDRWVNFPKNRCRKFPRPTQILSTVTISPSSDYRGPSLLEVSSLPNMLAIIHSNVISRLSRDKMQFVTMCPWGLCFSAIGVGLAQHSVRISNNWTPKTGMKHRFIDGRSMRRHWSRQILGNTVWGLLHGIHASSVQNLMQEHMSLRHRCTNFSTLHPVPCLSSLPLFNDSQALEVSHWVSHLRISS